MDQTDIDDDQLNALLFTDSDDDKPKKALAENKTQKSSSTPRASVLRLEKSVFPNNKSKQSEEALKSKDVVSNLDDDLFGSLTGPQTVKPVIAKDSKAPRKPKKRKSFAKDAKAKVGDSAAAAASTAQEPTKNAGSSSRDEALRILAKEEEEAEKSLKTLLDKPGTTQSKEVDQSSKPKPDFPDFSSDDDFLSSLDDKPSASSGKVPTSNGPTAVNIHSGSVSADKTEINNGATFSDTVFDDDESMINSRSGSFSADPVDNIHASSESAQPSSTQTNHTGLGDIASIYMPSTKTSFQRAVPLSARTGRRARSSNPLKIVEDSSIKSTQNDRQPDVSMPLEEKQQLSRTDLKTNVEALIPISEASVKKDDPSMSAAVIMDPFLSAKEFDISIAPMQTSLAASSEQPLNGNSAAMLSSTSIWDAIKSQAHDSSSTVAHPIRTSISSQIQEAASIHQMTQLQSDLTKAKRTIKEMESEIEGLKVQLKATAADYQEQLLAHTKANSEREIQIRIEEERKLKAALEHINFMHQSSMTSKERLHLEAMESLKRMHEMELVSVKRQHSDEHHFISMTEAISRSAVTVEGIQKEVREEIARVDQQRRADADAREKMLIERERKLQEDIKRHTNVIATLESLRREHDSERARLHEEEVRLQALQEFLMNESSGLKAQMANERAVLQDEKRNLDRSIKDWKLEVAANQAEIAFLRDKAQAKINEANAEERAGQRAFAQAHQMVISEGEIIRRDREMASKIRAEAEQEKQRIDQASNTLVEQRRQLSARMADVQKLGEKIRAQSEAVAIVCRQAQVEIAESKRLKQEAEQDRLRIKSERASVEELRTFVEAERRRMETDRLEIVRQRQKMIIESRDPKSGSKPFKRNDRDSKEYKVEGALQPLLNNENCLVKSDHQLKESSKNDIKSERKNSRLSVEQEKELFQFRMKAKVAADYAMNEKKIIRPI